MTVALVTRRRLAKALRGLATRVEPTYGKTLSGTTITDELIARLAAREAGSYPVIRVAACDAASLAREIDWAIRTGLLRW